MTPQRDGEPKCPSCGRAPSERGQLVGGPGGARTCDNAIHAAADAGPFALYLLRRLSRPGSTLSDLEDAQRLLDRFPEGETDASPESQSSTLLRGV